MQQESFSFSPGHKVWSVSALLADLQEGLNRQYFDVWVEGEISNFHRSAPGHCYFSLGDPNGQMRAALFAMAARRTQCDLRDGLQVLVRGRLGVYPTRGDLQLYVAHVEPLGRGKLQLAFEQLKEKLAAEGLFAVTRKRPLPPLPRRIGLVTSARGAVVADVLRILRRRYPNLSVLLFPVAVQGPKAAGELRQAVEYFSGPVPAAHCVDVLILARGGGSFEDLWPFSDEALARAIVRAPMPVISAVGHETDFCIADFVADLRAPTPSAAAELVVRTKADLLAEVSDRRRRLLQTMRFQLLRQQHRLVHLARHRAFEALRHRLAQRAQAVDEFGFRLLRLWQQRRAGASQRLAVATARLQQRDVGTVVALARQRLERQQRETLQAWRRLQQARCHRLEHYEALLAERNPLAVLLRGYALVYDPQGHLALSPDRFAEGDPVRIRLAAGWLDATAGPARRGEGT